MATSQTLPSISVPQVSNSSDDDLLESPTWNIAENSVSVENTAKDSSVKPINGLEQLANSFLANPQSMSPTSIVTSASGSTSNSQSAISPNLLDLQKLIFTQTAELMEQLQPEALSPTNSDDSGIPKVSRKGKEVAKFQCSDCSFVTSKLQVFNEHVATHKNNEKEHECHICHQKFKYKQSVKKHMMKHQGITPYHCKICDYKTNSHSSLEVHQRAHSGEKPFVCESCGMRFAQNSQLRVHMQYHSNANNPYKCELCEYQSPNYYKLTRHMKVHRERPYACDLCNKKFMLPYQLRNHAATHVKSPEALFTCHSCNETFTDKALYKKHIRDVHSLPATGTQNISQDPKPLPSTQKIETPITTQINHSNNTISKILHIPSAANPGGKPILNPYVSENSKPLSCSTELSPGLSSAVGQMSVLSNDSPNPIKDEEHFWENQEPKLDLPEDTVIIKPEAAPCDTKSWKTPLDIISVSEPSPVEIATGLSSDVNSEHSAGSPQISPDYFNASAEVIQSRMLSIFDKLLSKAENDFGASTQVPAFPIKEEFPDNDGILDLSIQKSPVLETSSGIKQETMDFDQPLDLCMKKASPVAETSETPPPAKIKRVLPDEEAIIRTDNPERPFKCGYCGKQFIQSSHIRVHLQYHVNAGNPFKCPDCSYTSASKYKLNLHLKVHKERRFQCPHCSSKFTLNCRLNQHIKLAHGDSLPYKCSLCNVTFSSTNLLAWHVANRHDTSAELKNCTPSQTTVALK